jgi:hypothetical protein
MQKDICNILRGMLFHYLAPLPLDLGRDNSIVLLLDGWEAFIPLDMP